MAFWSFLLQAAIPIGNTERSSIQRLKLLFGTNFGYLAYCSVVKKLWILLFTEELSTFSSRTVCKMSHTNQMFCLSHMSGIKFGLEKDNDLLNPFSLPSLLRSLCSKCICVGHCNTVQARDSCDILDSANKVVESDLRDIIEGLIQVRRHTKVLGTPGPVPFWTCICSDIETILS